MAAAAGLAETTRTYHAHVGDFDNNGWMDVFISRHQGAPKLALNDELLRPLAAWLQSREIAPELELLVGACSPPGGLVLDPCCGSGTTLVAAWW